MGRTNLRDYRVRELNAVTFMELPDGKWKVDIVSRKQSYSGVEVRSPMLTNAAEPTHSVHV